MTTLNEWKTILQSYLAPEIVNTILHRIEHDTAQLQHLLSFYQRLTLRQREIVQFTAQGYTNQEIADTLFITSASVAEHLTAIYKAFNKSLKLGSNNISTRYRLIHWMTRLFERYPELLI